MKKVLIWILALCLLAGGAMAESADDTVAAYKELAKVVSGYLTEVYGYTAEEADAFQIDVVGTDGSYWQASFYDPARPDWAYETNFDPNTYQSEYTDSPFQSEGQTGLVSEGMARSCLRQIKQLGSFAEWDIPGRPGRALLLDCMQQTGIAPTAALQEKLWQEDFTAAAALQEYFVSCYGDAAGWTEPLRQWCGEEQAAVNQPDEIARPTVVNADLPVLDSDTVGAYEKLAKHVSLNLTEIYGYLQEEVGRFQIEVAQKRGSSWHVRYYDQNHPEWVYTVNWSPETYQWQDMTTPFLNDCLPYYPGEGTVRLGLQQNWFANWDDASRESMRTWMTNWGVTPTALLLEGLNEETFTAGCALHEYFVSCYGDPIGWSPELTQWHNAELAKLGESYTPAKLNTPGVASYETTDDLGRKLTVTRFYQQIPDDLPCREEIAQLGYTPLCGAYMHIEALPSAGLLALEKDGRQVLAWLSKLEELHWKLNLIGENAMYQDRDCYILYEEDRDFCVVYPITDAEWEAFGVTRGDQTIVTGYVHCNEATGESTEIDVTYDGYDVTVYHKDGRVQEERVDKGVLRDLSRLDINTFPTTLTEVWQVEEPRPPEGYGVTSGVHLRKGTSSRSRDLGMYNRGTLVEILGEEPGDPFKWYRVRIGNVEGYMCSQYVDYEGSPCSNKPLTQFEPLPIGVTTEAVKLKEGTGLFAGTVTELPAGTRLHVLAERGKWLHVTIPRGEIDWMMDVGGVYGFVKADQVTMEAE